MIRWLTPVLASLGSLLIAVTVLPIDRYWLHAAAGPWNDPQGGTLIVLGADSLADIIGSGSYLRAVYAARDWKEGGFERMLISGGTSNGGLSVAAQMRDFLICQGVPAGAIALETQSLDTHQNAVYTARLLASTPGRKVLLTSDYHMYRAYRCFRKAGLQVEPRPFPDGLKRIQRWDLRWPVFVELCVEAIKSAYYFSRGWLR